MGIGTGISNTGYGLGLQRNGVTLGVQAVQTVQSVCAVRSIVFVTLPQPPVLLSSSILSTKNKIRPITILFSITTSVPLNAGDSLIFYAPHYTYNYDTTSLFISSPALDQLALNSSNGNVNIRNTTSSTTRAFTGIVDSRAKTITVLVNIFTVNTTVALEISSNLAVSIPSISCDSRLKNCPIDVSITSNKCPVLKQTIFEESMGLLTDTEINLYLSNVVPTMYPTSQPTNQPSSQPSGKPSGQPTFTPTKPTGQPTGWPTNQPTSYPTSLPTRYVGIIRCRNRDKL